jgi:hypothetical protein
MQTGLRKQQADIDKLGVDMRKKQLEIKRAEERARVAYSDGDETMSEQYIAEAAFLKDELASLSDTRTRMLAIKTELQTTDHQMRLEQSLSAASATLSKANKMGSSRKGKIDKVIESTTRQLNSISSSSSSTAAFLDSRHKPSTAEHAQNLRNSIADAEFESLGLVEAPINGAPQKQPPAATSADLDDLGRRLERLKE